MDYEKRKKVQKLIALQKQDLKVRKELNKKIIQQEDTVMAEQMQIEKSLEPVTRLLEESNKIRKEQELVPYNTFDSTHYATPPQTPITSTPINLEAGRLRDRDSSFSMQLMQNEYYIGNKYSNHLLEKVGDKIELSEGVLKHYTSSGVIKEYSADPSLMCMLLNTHPPSGYESWTKYKQAFPEQYRQYATIIWESNAMTKHNQPTHPISSKSAKYVELIKPLWDKYKTYRSQSATDTSASYKSLVAIDRPKKLRKKSERSERRERLERSDRSDSLDSLTNQVARMRTDDAGPSSKSGAGCTFDMYTEAPRQYVYFNDIGELVDRKKLLLAEISAGNNNPLYINEINSIDEELAEERHKNNPFNIPGAKNLYYQGTK